MDVLRVKVVRPARSPIDVARLVVNDRDLVDLVAEVERAFEANTGAYEPLPAQEVLAPSRHLLGEPQPLYKFGEGRVALLQCECGEPGCWPLVARIDVTEDRVTWSEFAQPHRPQWEYTGFGPFSLRANSVRGRAPVPDLCIATREAELAVAPVRRDVQGVHRVCSP